ncbi:uncharacterized protein LOC107464572 [Arachis duranensis]|uniref:Uncharacterized protein LOC107464572 n=1 Tax=Arachis duranensis TaxID=130453 RepID=A0A6P4C4K2_ARADU|nr:uncharacterized protein LOC107464572 [Arachis duranensis]
MVVFGEHSDDGSFGDIDGKNDSEDEINAVSEVEDRSWPNKDFEVDDAGYGHGESTVCRRMLVQDGEEIRDTQRGKHEYENDEEIGDDQSSTLEEQMLENRRAWELAVESGAVLYNEEEDIMAILQTQNDEIAQKKAGIEGDEKLRMIKDLKQRFRLNMLGLIETKRHIVTKFDVARILGCDSVGWEFDEVEGASGGLLLIWDEMDMHLVDLLLNDRKFTWFRGLSCNRIDRVLLSLEWVEEFPEIRLRGGPRGLSDHCPMVVEDTRLRCGPRPFWSLNSWFTHTDFLRMVKEEWRGLEEMQFTDKLKALTILLGRWHRDNFGDMDKKIMMFEEVIKKIDDMVINGVYDGTMEVLHNIASTRRRNNRIDALVIDERLVRNQARIKVAIREFYKKLYYQEESPLVGFRDGQVDMIAEEDVVALEVLPSIEEIRGAVWDCESSRAPGSDGYNMNFIKKCWDEVGAEFTAAMLEFFQTSRLPTDSNIAWAALVGQVELYGYCFTEDGIWAKVEGVGYGVYRHYFYVGVDKRFTNKAIQYGKRPKIR